MASDTSATPVADTKEETPSPSSSTTEPTIDAKVNAKPISGPAAGGKKKKEKGADKGAEGADKVADDDDQQRRRPGMIITEPVKGTRDFVPDEMRVRNWLFGHWKEVARLFGFQEYDAPILEHEELYTRKAGEEITQQMYNFTDKAGRAVSLRPELTPSLARILLKLGLNNIPLPIKWFSIPQCWRFEQTTRGRKREHYQWNMDIIGVTGVAAEAELLSAIVTFFKRVGYTSNQITIRVNSRKVLQSVLDKLKVDGDKFMPTCIVIDKLDKLKKSEIIAQLKEIGLSDEAIQGILGNITVKSLEELGDRLGTTDEAFKELSELFKLAEAYGFRDWIEFDASVIRGLSYYTGVVFEGVDKTGSLPRAICGGGRYDRLFEMFGATKKESQPCAGFGFGDCVITELLREHKLLPKELELPQIDVVVALFNDSLMPAAMQVSTLLRSKGQSVDLILNKKKNVSWSYAYANRLGAKRVVLVAPSEWENQSVKVKDMTKGYDENDKGVVVRLEDL
jgi:histidyl-tRNA synthetase